MQALEARIRPGSLLVLDGPMEDVRRGYQRSRVQFPERVDRLPALDGALAVEGGGRSWSVVHSGPVERFHRSVAAHGGEVVQSRDATLEEIFVARVGRSSHDMEAA